MSKFKKGAIVKRTCNPTSELPIGVYVVDAVSTSGRLKVEGHYNEALLEKYFEMYKFQVGDTVIRTDDGVQNLAVGTVTKVTAVSPKGALWVDAHPSFALNPDNFELYQEPTGTQNSTEQAVLTPLKVAEYLLAGTPELEYQGDSGGGWFTVVRPDIINMQTIQQYKFRIKPQTICINGVDVPKPIELHSASVVWCIALSAKSVYRTIGSNVSVGALYWATAEDAQAVLDAMLIPFKQSNT